MREETMQSISIALAAAMLASVIGTAPAAAAPLMAGNTVEQANFDLIHDRSRRGGGDDDREWDDDDDDDRDRRKRHYRPRCHTEWVFRFSHYGPKWYPVRVCHRPHRYW
jgi:hypothetical protein